MSNLSENLKKFRTLKNIKQEELANALGKSKNVISNWERGDNRPDADMIEKICKILSITPNDLLGYEDDDEFLELNEIEVAFAGEVRKLTKEDKEDLLNILKSINKNKK